MCTCSFRQLDGDFTCTRQRWSIGRSRCGRTMNWARVQVVGRLCSGNDDLHRKQAVSVRRRRQVFGSRWLFGPPADGESRVSESGRRFGAVRRAAGHVRATSDASRTAGPGQPGAEEPPGRMVRARPLGGLDAVFGPWPQALGPSEGRAVVDEVVRSIFPAGFVETLPAVPAHRGGGADCPSPPTATGAQAPAAVWSARLDRLCRWRPQGKPDAQDGTGGGARRSWALSATPGRAGSASGGLTRNVRRPPAGFRLS